MKELVKSNRNRFFLFNSIFIFNSVWFWRNVEPLTQGFLPGDIGDARFTTVLYEHWYQFLTGNTGLSQTLFFYPTYDTLVFSDSFFLQGLVHSVFRFMGLNVVNSWLIATILLQLFSAYSAVVIAHKFKLRALPGAILIIYWGYNSTMWAQTTHVQHVLYPFVGWILLAGFGFMRARTPIRKAGYLALTLNLLLILALSSTYPFIFSLVFICLGGLLHVLWTASKHKNGTNFKAKLIDLIRTSVNKSSALNVIKLTRFPIILSLPLVFVFLKIYILDTNYSTDREASAISFFSPTFTDLISVPSDNLVFGRVIQKLLSYGLPGTGESGMGFTPIFLLLLLATVLFMLPKVKKVQRESLFVPVMLLLVALIVEVLILKDARGFSLWFLTFEQIPGFGALRALSRIHTFQYMAGALAIAIILNKYVIHFGPLKRIGSLRLNQKLVALVMPLVIITMIVSESTPNIGRWDAQDMHFVKITKKSENDFKKCESFSLVPSDVQMDRRPMFAWLIDAQVLSMEYSKPTLQGYSGGQPADYGINTSETSQVLEASIREVVAAKKLKDSCLLVPVQPEKIKSKWKVVPIIG